MKEERGRGGDQKTSGTPADERPQRSVTQSVDPRGLEHRLGRGKARETAVVITGGLETLASPTEVGPSDRSQDT